MAPGEADEPAVSSESSTQEAGQDQSHVVTSTPPPATFSFGTHPLDELPNPHVSRHDQPPPNSDESTQNAERDNDSSSEEEDGNQEEDEDDSSDEEGDEEGDHPGTGFFCHSCQLEIAPLMDSGTPTCPHCHSEFVEEIEIEDDPRGWESHSDEEDHHHVNDFLFTSAALGGADATREGLTQVAPGDVAGLLQQWLGQMLGQPQAHRRDETGGPANTEGATTDTEFDANVEDGHGHAPAAEAEGETMGGTPAAAEGPDGAHALPRSRSGPGLGAGGLNFTIRAGPGRAVETQMQPLDMNPLLEILLGATGGTGDREGTEGGGPRPPNPFAALFNMVGNPGDYVFGQRGLDDIVSQLMEQAGQRNAPPPAPQDIITTLPKKNVSVADLGGFLTYAKPSSATYSCRAVGDHADCSICQDEYSEGEEVIELPCKHLFHEPCIKSWLTVNGTCPVCRHSLVAETEQTTTQQAPIHPHTPSVQNEHEE
ncbi:hypothetical protein DFS34DRAFT_50562 [Phlyctochytrium arcticum]|nr:hypothetical protein DFS34DRAFT_50562 [Phlyctochytrium arcticum]